MKKVFYFLAICSFLASCAPKKIDESKATTIRLIFQVECANDFNLQLQAIKQRIEQTEMNVIVQSIEGREADGLITVNIAEVEDLPAFRELISHDVEVQFMDVYRIGDSEITPLLTRLSSDTLFYGIFKPFQSIGGYSNAIIGQTTEENKTIVLQRILDIGIPRDIIPAWSAKPTNYLNEGQEELYDLFFLKRPKNWKNIISNANFSSIGYGPSPYTGEIEVNLAFDAKGTKLFAQQTTRAAADGNRQIAIMIDKEVMSAPRVNEQITGGRCSISGNFSIEEAKRLASQLEQSKLPCGDMQLIEEKIVGPE